MSKRGTIGIFLLLATFLVLAGCDQVDISNLSDEDLARLGENLCNKPYIRVGTECCLDQNDNAICDFDEIEEPTETVCNTEVVEGVTMYCCTEEGSLPFCCADENQNQICDSEEVEEPVIDDEPIPADLGPGEVTCPEELYDRDYDFLVPESGGAWFNNLIRDNDFHREDNKCVRCDFGSEPGQNINYKYCEEFVWGPIADEEGNIIYEEIYIDIVLKETGQEDYEGTETGGTFFQGQCDSAPDVSGVLVKNEIQEVNCYLEKQEIYVGCGNGACLTGETCSNCPQDCGECSDDYYDNARGGCQEGKCWSNGVCCDSTHQYSCNGACYTTKEAAIAADPVRCSTQKVIC